MNVAVLLTCLISGRNKTRFTCFKLEIWICLLLIFVEGIVRFIKYY